MHFYIIIIKFQYCVQVTVLCSRLISVLDAGEPHPNLCKGMEDEHCAMYGHDEPFETTNYGVRTCPRQEYEITTGKRDCMAKDMLDRKGSRVRAIRRIEELKQLKAAQKAGLGEEELIAVVRESRNVFLCESMLISSSFNTPRTMCALSDPLQ